MFRHFPLRLGLEIAGGILLCSLLIALPIFLCYYRAQGSPADQVISLCGLPLYQLSAGQGHLIARGQQILGGLCLALTIPLGEAAARRHYRK